ncbi:MAG: bacterial Ig-like domain-containing protein [Oscillospiraceae bacterium]|nr:bacterial Ig-like domain-containing protein [Oscillospiraceae bacterium]
MPFVAAEETILPAQYDLRNSINITLKNQYQTGACWAFATNTSLESNIAKTKAQNYIFSTRFLDYATSQSFIDGKNPNGGNRQVGDAGSPRFGLALYTNGVGPILETAMPFENNENKMPLGSIQNKKVEKQIDSYRAYPQVTSSTDMTTYRNMIKQNIMNYGSIVALVFYDQTNYSDFNLSPNGKTISIYCSDDSAYTNHAVSIIGWDDNYSKSNFKVGNQPKNDGAFIVQNSWGANPAAYPNYAGYDYISYEDALIYREMYGIIDTEDVSYNNIYQYDSLGPRSSINQSYGADVFTRNNTNSKEMLTEVSVASIYDASYEIYVNSKDGTLNSLSLTKVKTTDTLNAGYNTIKLDTPIELTGSQFAIAVKYTAPQSNGYPVSVELDPASMWGATYADDYWAGVPISQESYSSNDGNAYYLMTDYDTCIKGFTTEKAVTSIAVETQPTKLNYVEGQKLDLTGLVVTITYADKTTENVPYSDFASKGFSTSIANGKALTVANHNGKAVTLTCYGKTANTDTLTVVPKVVTGISVKNQPTKLSYIEGDSLDLSGLVVTLVYNDNTTEDVLYENFANKNIAVNSENGTSLTIADYNAKPITVTCNDETANTDNLTVVPKVVTGITIKTQPSVLNYIKGQKLDLSGLTATLTYNNGDTEDVTYANFKDKNIIVSPANGTVLTMASNNEEQVTLTCNEKTTSYNISVTDYVLDITLVPPTKTIYNYNENIDLTGGTVTRTMASGTTQTAIPLTDSNVSISGYNKTRIGNQTITVTYMNKTSTFNIMVKNPITDIVMAVVPKQTYNVGEPLDVTTGKIDIIKANGEKVETPILPEMVSGFNSNVETKKQTITVTYTEDTIIKTCTYTISVVNNSTTDVVNTPTTNVVNTPTENVVNTPTTSVVNTPTTDVVNTPTTSVVNTPTTDVVNTPTTSVANTPTMNSNSNVSKANLNFSIYNTTKDGNINYIFKIPETTTAKALKGNLADSESNAIKLYNMNNTELMDTDVVGTGMNLNYNDVTYTLVVTGDVTGDGKITTLDLSKLKLYLVEDPTNTLSGAFLKAADVNTDASVKVSDLSIMKGVFVGLMKL